VLINSAIVFNFTKAELLALTGTFWSIPTGGVALSRYDLISRVKLLSVKLLIVYPVFNLTEIFTSPDSPGFKAANPGF
jgi:hypothetical protein